MGVGYALWFVLLVDGALVLVPAGSRVVCVRVGEGRCGRFGVEEVAAATRVGCNSKQVGGTYGE